MAEKFSVKEDTLRYCIYLIDAQVSQENANSLILSIYEKIGNYISDYIWQCQPFCLRASPPTPESGLLN
jgi:hypothetical protein